MAEATNRYAIGTNIRKNFDGTFYRGKIASDNGKWYKIKYNDGDEEELTHRQTTMIIEYNPISFTAVMGQLSLQSSIMQKFKQTLRSQTSVRFKILHSQYNTR